MVYSFELFRLLTQLGDLIKTDSPVVCVDFINHHDRCFGILTEDIDQQLRSAGDQLLFLFLSGVYPVQRFQAKLEGKPDKHPITRPQTITEALLTI